MIMKKFLLFIYVSTVWMGYAFAQQTVDPVSYTHLTLPTKLEV